MRTDGFVLAGCGTTVERRYDGEIPCDTLRGGSTGGAPSPAEEVPTEDFLLVETSVGDFFWSFVRQ